MLTKLSFVQPEAETYRTSVFFRVLMSNLALWTGYYSEEDKLF